MLRWDTARSPVRQIRKIRNQKKAGIVSSEKITDLTDCTDIGGAVRHHPPPVRQIRKIRTQQKKIFRSTFTSHFGEQPNLTQSNRLVWFFKDNSIIFRPFENFFIHLPAIRYISYQEMNIIANFCVNPNEQCQTCLNDAMASKGAWQRTTNSVEFNNNWM